MFEGSLAPLKASILSSMPTEGGPVANLRIQPESEETAIVLVGPFNPDQYQPQWFAANGLIGHEEAKEIELDAVSKAVTKFTIPSSSITVVVERNRFVVGAPVFLESAFDLVLNTFERVLPGQSLTSFGINRTVHFETGSMEIRNKVGYELAPLTPWGKFGDKIAAINQENDIARMGGMLSLHLKIPREKSEPKGGSSVRVEPSSRLNTSGIFMLVNDHFDIEKDNQSAQSACTSLRANWETSLNFCNSCIDQVMSLVESAKKSRK